jgi:hypothetical protein
MELAATLALALARGKLCLSITLPPGGCALPVGSHGRPHCCARKRAHPFPAPCCGPSPGPPDRGDLAPPVLTSLSPPLSHPSTTRALARALGVTVPDLYKNPITPPPSQDRLGGTAQSYEHLRDKLRDAFPGIEYDADLERMAEQFVVELGWLQERTFPLYIAQPPSTTLSAHDLLELADSFYRFRMERWRHGEAGGAGRVRVFGANTSNTSPLSN